jgi:hypothetical protein
MVKFTWQQRVQRFFKSERQLVAGIAVLLLILCSEAIADIITTGVL